MRALLCLCGRVCFGAVLAVVGSLHYIRPACGTRAAGAWGGREIASEVPGATVGG